MKNFKAVITTNKDEKVGQNQHIFIVNLPFELRMEIDKNNQICDVRPRSFMGVDLFSKYHGRTSDWCEDLVEEINVWTRLTIHTLTPISCTTCGEMFLGTEKLRYLCIVNKT